MPDAELNILMIEDNPGDQFLITELLNLSTVKLNSLFVTATIEDALNTLKKEPIDIILLDLSLPDSSGINSFKSVKQYASHVPVVILSGFSDMNMAFEAITLGAQDYLIKGDFDEKLLAKAIFYSRERMQSIIATEEILKLSEEKKQKEIADAMISAQESERQEIGRELHDNINQLLTTAQLHLRLIPAKDENDRSLISETSRFINTAIDEVRRLSHSLIPLLLDDSALKESLLYIFQIIAKTSGLLISWDFNQFDETLASDKLKLAIYRIVQEQINNILKHARATKMHIRLVQQDGKTELVIKDDGIGFDTSEKPMGIGLKNIRARTSLFNGAMKIISSPGNGCELRVTFNQHTHDYLV
jgi:signal transduction histidine kinase